MRQLLVLALCFCAFFFTASTLTLAASAGDAKSWSSPNWDRDLALLSASSVDTASESDRLFSLLTQSSSDTALHELKQLAYQSNLSIPARESTLLQFTTQLRQLPPFSVDSAVLDFLSAYQNQTLVAHEESPGLGVPLYPIRAAVQGVIHQWTRQQVALDAVELLAIQPRQLVDVYAESADLNVRAGIETVLGEADPTALHTMLDYGMPLLAGKPELTGLLGKAAIELGDWQALSRVLGQGHGHMLVEITRQAKQRFAASELSEILLANIDSAPAATASILIAEWAPDVIRQQAVGAALMQKLEHAELGSTIALAMVQWGSDQQLEALMAMATVDQTSLTAKRVQTALVLNQAAASRGRQ